MSLILGLLAGVGRSYMDAKQRSSDRKWTEQRDALKEQRDLERLQKEQEFRQQENELNRKNQLDIANIYGQRQRDADEPLAIDKALGIMSQYGTEDPTEAMRLIDAEVAKRSEADSLDPSIEYLLKDRSALYPMIGRSQRRGIRGMDNMGDRTGDLNPHSPSAGGNAQQTVGDQNWATMYRALLGRQSPDPTTYSTLQNYFPQLQLPPYGIASPDLFQQPVPQ